MVHVVLNGPDERVGCQVEYKKKERKQHNIPVMKKKIIQKPEYFHTMTTITKLTPSAEGQPSKAAV